MRRINSLKRQITIKEKMLEVGARYSAWLPAQLIVVVVVVDGGGGAWLPAQLIVVVGGGGAILHVVGVVVVDGAHLANYCPSEQPPVPSNISHRCMPLTWLSLPLPWIFKM